MCRRIAVLTLLALCISRSPLWAEPTDHAKSEASALKVKAEILSSILEYIRAKGYTQSQLIDILDEYQPSVSNLLKGRISQVSIEKLLRYADRLHLQTSIAVRPVEKKIRFAKSQVRTAIRKVAVAG